MLTLGSAACSTGESEAGEVPACEACVGGRCVSRADIETVRARFSPPPSRDEAERVLLEARAIWHGDGSGGEPSLDELLLRRRRFLRDAEAREGEGWRAKVAAQLADLMLRAEVRLAESCGVGE